MPTPEREPLPTIIRMKVMDERAPHAGETGWIVNTVQTGTLLLIDLQFEQDGQPTRYEREELELCQM